MKDWTLSTATSSYPLPSRKYPELVLLPSRMNGLGKPGAGMVVLAAVEEELAGPVVVADVVVDDVVVCV